MNCGTETLERDCVKLEKQAEQNKPVECDKKTEIEKIKRQLYHLIDRVDALKDK